jgi:hypothetical protein
MSESQERSDTLKLRTHPVTNFSEWSERFIVQAYEAYGDVAEMLTTGERREFEIPDVPPAPGRTKAQMFLWQEEAKLVLKRRQDALVLEPKLLGKMLNSLSKECDFKVRAQSDFTDAFSKKDALKMWKLIEMVATNSEQAKATNGQIEKIEFMKKSQGTKSLEEYLHEVTVAYKRLKSYGVELPEADVVYQFLLGLRQDVFGVVVSNWIARREVPETLEKAKVLVMDWYDATQRVMSGGSSDKVTASATIMAAIAAAKECKFCSHCCRKGHTDEECWKKKKAIKKAKKGTLEESETVHATTTTVLRPRLEIPLPRKSMF